MKPSEYLPSDSAPRSLAAAPPAVLSVSPTSGATGSGTVVTVNGTGFTGATAVRFGATQGTAVTVVSDTQITVVSPPGTGTVQVTVTTPAGTSNQFVTFGYTTTPAPVLSALTPNTGPAAGGTVVTLSGMGFTGATAVRFGSVSASFTVVSSTQIAATAPAGSGTAQVTVVTPGGTSNALPYTYTAVSTPVLSSVSPNTGPAAGGTVVTLSGTGLAGATAVRFGSVSATFTVVSSTQITSIAPAGTGTAQVTVTTPGGTSNGVGFTYTSVAVPVLSSLSPTSGPSAGGTAVTLTGSGLSNASAVRFGSTAASSFTVVSDTVITAVAPAGTGTVQVTVTTPGGTSNGVAFTYTSVAVPVLSSVSPNSGSAAGGTSVTLTGSGLSNASAVRFGSTAASSFTVVSDTLITAVAPAGTGTVQVTVTTPGGTSNGLPFTYTSVVAPVLSSLSPVSGPSAGGTAVTLTGSGLTNASVVRFGSTAASSFTVVSDTVITAVAPAGTGTVQVTVTTPGGTSNGISYTYVMAPGLTAVSPNQGPTSGGNTVTLTGTNLTGTTAVAFGTTPAASFTVVSPTQITAVAPPSVAGVVGITVTAPGGSSTLPNSYFFVNAPVLTAVQPLSGPLAGGNTVTLVGRSLVEATAVRFGSTAATSFTVVSDSEVTAVAPAGVAGPVQVTVTTVGGTSNPVTYTYLTPPVITSLAPTQGSTSGGGTVTLTGSSFSQATKVFFGSQPVGFTLVSDTHLVADVPAGAVGPVDVTVVGPGGTSAPQTYTRLSSPGI
ncbi:beta strand repeat-containing protein [Streptomyces kronopolitis]|uniref:beta strand repeat-containing protein n=1 Tax=Streptomyces kronopolitis TaxID=1612435 RepID=UPI0034207D98